MSVVKSENIEKNKVKIEIAVDADTLNKGIDRVYMHNRTKIAVPGFRKGKAPRSIVERMYGESVFFEDAVGELYPAAYEAAVLELGLEPVDRPDVEIQSIAKADGFTFTATVTVKPEVAVHDYKGIAVTKKPVQVAEEDVEEELKRLADRNARLVDVDDRPAQMDDTVVFDFEGFVDGAPFEGGKAEKHTLVLGSGQFIPGFEEQIVGHSVGEEFEVHVKFPEDYQAEELKGKDSVFQCKLHEIKFKELPALDDEFAKDLGEYDTLDELKASIRTRILDSRTKAAENEVENKLIDAVIANLEADIPAVMFEHKIDEMVRDFEYRLQMQGIGLDMYYQYTGMDAEAFRKTFAAQAEKQVKIRLALEKIAALENIVCTEEELDEEYAKMAEQYKMDVEKVKAAIPSADLERDLCVNKAIDIIKNTAVVTEAEEPEAGSETEKAAEIAE